MEDTKPSGVVARHGVLRLPPGFRFHPTDEELVVQYLRTKVFSCPLPASIIPDINLSNFDPWDLPGYCCCYYYYYYYYYYYFPCVTSENPNHIMLWSANEVTVVMMAMLRWVRRAEILLQSTGGKVHEGEPIEPGGEIRVLEGHREGQADHVFSVQPVAENVITGLFRKLASSVLNSIMLVIMQSCVAVPSGDWVLCRVFKKKRATKMEAETDDGDTNHGVGFIDFMGQRDGDGSHSATSVSEASCVTYGSSSGEETSSGTSLP
ncbi:hypothetical protein B296_00029108 [Ensete ventricosum]|uniref:NAC domain-containing protein n=1 Tax=Ensete ventricosum TaxID=4639 RepID=A0A426Z403_ENSVE|nr:hypothetical protein B296_00029108 [Ensete ventricosum]